MNEAESFAGDYVASEERRLFFEVPYNRGLAWQDDKGDLDRAIEDYDEPIRRLVDDIFETMYEAPGKRKHVTLSII